MAHPGVIFGVAFGATVRSIFIGAGLILGGKLLLGW